MNIFFLDRDIRRAARYHCDQHIVKMPLETAQILCAVLHRYGIDAPYKATHVNHPSVLWAGDSAAHYHWLCKFGRALCAEYTYRYGRLHKCEGVIESLLPNPPLPDGGCSDPPQALPEGYRGDDVIAAYRKYYRADKAVFAGKGPAKWTRRRRPSFMNMAASALSDLSAKSARTLPAGRKKWPRPNIPDDADRGDIN